MGVGWESRAIREKRVPKGPCPQHPDYRHETTVPIEVGPAEEMVLYPGFIDL